ncbi:hypothetical protein [Pantoea sp. At-9b]|uniref:hypothetical protein n=1 Tax=Pantoea sp. (strain At-9b) TaxID=592316 RepID=UPI0001B401CF|nr:hypothetical protein [Pantoea sp. At-9b]ADU68731.1 hypothetical protein Pat9b_1413 [Pantoea sp. At-9b]
MNQLLVIDGVSVRQDKVGRYCLLVLESASKLLNFSSSSKLGAYQKIQQHYGIPNMMPVYAIDAPADAADGSSRASFSLTSSLKTHGIKLTASQAYKLLEKVGVVEQKVRVSRSAPSGVKNFWSLTAKGYMYGKNMSLQGSQNPSQFREDWDKATEDSQK